MFQSEILTGVIRCDKLDTEISESGDEMSKVRKHFVFHGKVTMEVQGRETLINKLLVGLNQNQFISIEWIDTREIPLEEEKAFTVK